MYQHYKVDGQVWERGIMRVADKAFIPFDDANTDYVEYKKWIEAGNTPEPADE